MSRILATVSSPNSAAGGGSIAGIRSDSSGLTLDETTEFTKSVTFSKTRASDTVTFNSTNVTHTSGSTVTYDSDTVTFNKNVIYNKADTSNTITYNGTQLTFSDDSEVTFNCSSLNAVSFFIPPISGGAPTVSGSVVNKAYADGDQTITGIKTYQQIPVVAAGVNPSTGRQLVPKDYVDGFLPLAGGTVTGSVAFNVLPSSSATPSAATDLVTKTYADQFLPLGGGSVTGSVTFSTLPSSSATPSAGTDLVTKTYTDQFIPLTGGTVTGNVVFNVLPSSSQTPSVSTDLVTKSYVDGLSSGGGSSFTAGMIMLWSGTIASIPTGWVLCDGQNGTPNLSGKFILGYGTTGSSTGNQKSGTIGANAEPYLVESEHLPHLDHNASGTFSGDNFPKVDSPSGTVTDYSLVGSNSADGTNAINIDPVFWLGLQNHGVASGTNPDPYYPPYYVLAYIIKT
jgi:hypothetical protein